jgi:hypothetical protein
MDPHLKILYTDLLKLGFYVRRVLNTPVYLNVQMVNIVNDNQHDLYLFNRPYKENK